jgi:hypothetical protein
MILEKQTEVVILSDGEETQSSIGMSLDLDSAQMLMQMLSKNLYSDGIGSTIRETASNALDSHRRAGVTDPIIVGLRINAESNYEFTVEDFGSGLDADDVENIISKYGKSTKRADANALGMFGLGFKSPLAYCSSFFFTCRKDGVERKYMMYEGEDVNTIDLLYETPTTERNGVKIIVPVKWSDRGDFYEKTKEQLAYFENVFFDVNVGGSGIDNDFIIARSEHFQFSEIANDSNLHLCLDNVYYPLDYTKLGINTLTVPIGLKFSLSDGIFPTPNRESIRYTSEAKAIILAKLVEVADYYMIKFNESIVDSSDLHAAFDFYTARERYVVQSFDPTNKIAITSLIKMSTIVMKTPSIIGITHLKLGSLANNKECLLTEYQSKYKLENDRFSETKGYYSRIITFRDVRPTLRLFTERLGGLKKQYIKHIATHGSYMFAKKENPYKLFPSDRNKHEKNNFYSILNLHAVPKELWRTHIKEFKALQDMLLANVENVDDLVIPQAWIDARKKKNIANSTGRAIKLKGDISCKIGAPLLRWVDGKDSKLEPTILKLEEIARTPCLYVYGSVEDIPELDKLFAVTEGKQKLKTVVLSARELKVVNSIELHNLMPIRKFMEGKSKIFKRMVTGFLIQKLIEKFGYVFANRANLSSISSSLVKNMDKLVDYKSANYVCSRSDVQDAMVEVAETHNLFDGDMYPEYLAMKELLETLPFLNPVMKTMTSYSGTHNPDMIEVLCDLFKYYKQRIDYTNYHLVIEDNVIEEILSEEETTEVINQSIN